MRKRKTDESSVLFRQIANLSLILGVLACVPALFFGPEAALGIWTGVFMCLGGLKMIQVSCHRPMSRSGGFINYSIRYAYYGLVIYACFVCKVPVLALLAGVSLQKLAVMLVPLLRKEGGHGANQRS